METRSVNRGTEMRREPGPKAFFRLQYLLFALVFVAAALQVSPSASAHDGDLVSPTPTASVTVTDTDVGGTPNETLVKLVYKREGMEPDVTQFYRLIEPVNTDHPDELEPDLPPKAVVVLFNGGSGRVGFDDSNRRRGLDSSNFVIRSRWAFAAAGPFVVAINDAARNFHDEEGAQCSTDSGSGLRGCRLSTEHMIDVANLVQDLKARFNLPVWLVGTSRGTISAASAAARLSNIYPANYDGLILTATLTNDDDPHEDVFDDDARLELIDVPVLIASHEDDGCFVTPPGDRIDLKAALVSAPKVKLKLFKKRGHGALSNDCNALAPHGFFGIEAKVINKIAAFINSKI